MAASRFIKDVPTTLTDMSDAVTEAVPYTLPDGSYTNAADVVEVRGMCIHACVAWLMRGGSESAYTRCIAFSAQDAKVCI